MLHLHRFKEVSNFDYEENNAPSGHDIRQKPEHQAHSVSLARRLQKSVPFSAYVRAERDFAVGHGNRFRRQHGAGSATSLPTGCFFRINNDA
jgi:hypothetical protein